jgi:sulfur carrier protein ThiS
MHRGSSKDVRAGGPASETLPLSASPPPPVNVTFEITRGASCTVHSLEVPIGSTVRVALKRLGVAAEGCAVLEDGRSVPLDMPIHSTKRLTIVPTFSGG